MVLMKGDRLSREMRMAGSIMMRLRVQVRVVVRV